MVTHGQVEPGHVVQRCAECGMFLATRLSLDLRRLLVERLGSAVFAGRLIQQSQVAKYFTVGKVLFSDGVFENLTRFEIQWLSPGKLTYPPIENTEAVERTCVALVLWVPAPSCGC